MLANRSNKYFCVPNMKAFITSDTSSEAVNKLHTVLIQLFLYIVTSIHRAWGCIVNSKSDFNCKYSSGGAYVMACAMNEEICHCIYLEPVWSPISKII